MLVVVTKPVVPAIRKKGTKTTWPIQNLTDSWIFPALPGNVCTTIIPFAVQTMFQSTICPAALFAPHLLKNDLSPFKGYIFKFFAKAKGNTFG